MRFVVYIFRGRLGIMVLLLKIFLLDWGKRIAISNNHTIVITEKLVMSGWGSDSHSTVSSNCLIIWLLVRSLSLRVNSSNSCRSMHHMVSGRRSLTLFLLESLIVILLAAYRSCNISITLLFYLLLLHWSSYIILGT